jgi:hypothetical protein
MIRTVAIGSGFLLAACAIPGAAASSASDTRRVEAAAEYRTRHAAACARLSAKPATIYERIIKESVKRPCVSMDLAAVPECGHASLRKSDVKRTIDAHVDDVRTCYEEALLGTPAAQGRVEIRFGIGPSGKVEAVAVARNSTGVEQIACCIADAVLRWRFPKPEGSGLVLVTYPFVLEQT